MIFVAKLKVITQVSETALVTTLIRTQSVCSLGKHTHCRRIMRSSIIFPGTAAARAMRQAMTTAKARILKIVRNYFAYERFVVGTRSTSGK
jgi:hypothetical protein